MRSGTASTPPGASTASPDLILGDGKSCDWHLVVLERLLQGGQDDLAVIRNKAAHR